MRLYGIEALAFSQAGGRPGLSAEVGFLARASTYAASQKATTSPTRNAT
jgi:hypothetical protein